MEEVFKGIHIIDSEKCKAFSAENDFMLYQRPANQIRIRVMGTKNIFCVLLYGIRSDSRHPVLAKLESCASFADNFGENDLS